MGYGFVVSENFIESYCSWLQIATRPGIFKMLTLIYHKEKYIDQVYANTRPGYFCFFITFRCCVFTKGEANQKQQLLI